MNELEELKVRREHIQLWLQKQVAEIAAWGGNLYITTSLDEKQQLELRVAIVFE